MFSENNLQFKMMSCLDQRLTMKSYFKSWMERGVFKTERAPVNTLNTTKGKNKALLEL